MAVFFLTLLWTSSLFAGFNGLTVHSRANCVNNESISWDWTTYWVLFTTSDHCDLGSGALIHSIGTGWQSTWRSAAVHWGEGRGGWLVHGHHWINDHGRVLPIGSETVNDCSIYDGWWDRNK